MKLKRILAIVISALMLVLCLTGCATTETATTTGTDTTSSSSGASMIIVIVVMIAVMYFLMIRPENKRKKQQEEMRSSIQVGDTITTIGGIIGKVVSVREDSIVFETSEDRVRMQVTKWAISSTGKQKDQDTPNTAEENK